MICTLLLAGVIFSRTDAQQGYGYQDRILDSLDQTYGPDLTLVNGRKYANYYLNAEGDPFLIDKNFRPGTVTIQDKSFEDIQLNYDIYNQEVILEIPSGIHGNQRIIVPDRFLEAFTIEHRSFNKMTLPGIKKRIFEVVNDGAYQLILTHDKSYTLNRDVNSRGYRFSDNKRKIYLFSENTLVPLATNRSFKKALPSTLQKIAHDYFRTHHLKIRKASVEELKYLMKFINSSI
jgi:hypothetical protein